MRSIRLIGSITLVLVLMAVAAAAQKPSFTGTRVMAKEKSTGLPPDVDQVMKVNQAGDKIELETKVYTEQGSFSISDSYTVSGKEVDFTPQTPQGPNGKGKRTAKWTDEGLGVEVVEEATLETPNGAVTQQVSRKWLLSADGKTLTIELNIKGPQGAQTSRRLFTRKAEG